MIRVGIVGSTGLVGESLVRVVLGHPQAELTVAGSDHAAGRPLGDLLPSLAGEIDLTCETPTTQALAERCDVVFLAKKSPESLKLVPPVLEAGVKVIDIGGELRFKDPAVYAKWYGGEHPCPELLAEAVYGLPELFREEIRSARLVGNPGCYPTGAILAAAPLLDAGLIEPDGMIFDAISGVSGAGRIYSPKSDNLFVSCNENLRAYGVGTHRHTPEIERALGSLFGQDLTVTFTPHLAPLDRGLLTTMYARPAADELIDEALREAAARFYADAPFVRIRDEPGAVRTADTRASNYLDWGACFIARSRTVVAVTAQDNTVKGAAGQAIQNMNLMFGLDEAMGLRGRSL